MKNTLVAPGLTPTKALRELTERFEAQTSRMRQIEQQFLDLSARVNYIENSNNKANGMRH